MVARGPGAVGCAHCTRLGAETACIVCKRLVCARCAADWATCTEPSGRVVRLGLTARLRDVDPTGRLGLVSHWRQPLRLFDLRRLRWIRDVHFPRRVYLWNRRWPPRLTGDGRLLHAEWHPGSDYERGGTPLFAGIRARRVDGRTGLLIASHGPEHGTAVTATGDLYYYVTDTQRVAVFPPGAELPWLLEPLPRKVVHAAYIDGARRLLASGSWCELALHHLSERGELEALWHGQPEATGDVRWIALAGPWLAYAVVTVGGGVQVEIRRFVDRDRDPLTTKPLVGPIVHHHAGAPLRAASISGDGHFLALALDRGVLVHELGTDHVARFDEHTDRVNLVRFAGDDHLLITADTDNRVILRPRTAAGYSLPLIALDVPEDGVELPALGA